MPHSQSPSRHREFCLSFNVPNERFLARGAHMAVIPVVYEHIHSPSCLHSLSGDVFLINHRRLLGFLFAHMHSWEEQTANAGGGADRHPPRLGCGMHNPRRSGSLLPLAPSSPTADHRTMLFSVRLHHCFIAPVNPWKRVPLYPSGSCAYLIQNSNYWEFPPRN